MKTVQCIDLWNVAKQARLIGQTAILTDHPFNIRVKILNVKNSYGTTRLEVTPVDGNGIGWVSCRRITLSDATLQTLDGGCPQS